MPIDVDQNPSLAALRPCQGAGKVSNSHGPIPEFGNVREKDIQLMASKSAKALIDSLRSGDLPQVRVMLRSDPDTARREVSLE